MKKSMSFSRIIQDLCMKYYLPMGLTHDCDYYEYESIAQLYFTLASKRELALLFSTEITAESLSFVAGIADDERSDMLVGLRNFVEVILVCSLSEKNNSDDSLQMCLSPEIPACTLNKYYEYIHPDIYSQLLT